MTKSFCKEKAWLELYLVVCWQPTQHSLYTTDFRKKEKKILFFSCNPLIPRTMRSMWSPIHTMCVLFYLFPFQSWSLNTVDSACCFGILSGNRFNVVDVARADCIHIMNTVSTFISSYVMYELFFDRHVIQIRASEALSRCWILFEVFLQPILFINKCKGIEGLCCPFWSGS